MKGLAVALVVLAAAPYRANAWNRGRARIFATLPAGSSGPEGLEVDAEGRVYVTTFGFAASGPVSGVGQLFVFGEGGRLLRQVPIAGSTAPARSAIPPDDQGVARHRLRQRTGARRGSADGDLHRLHDDDGAPVQMLFPASLRFLGDELLVTNLSLDLRLFSPSFAAVDSEWCAQVSRYTVVKIRARIRGFSGRPE